MDAEKRFEAIPELPCGDTDERPPTEAPDEPQLSPETANRLRSAYRLWCTVTVGAALLTLALLGVRWLGELRDAGDGAMRRLIFTRVLGVGEADGEASLIEIMLGQVLYPRAIREEEPAIEVIEPIPLPPAETAPETEAPMPVVTAPVTEALDVYAYDPSQVPADEHPILPLDLSLLDYGPTYISNETAYSPNLEALLKAEAILPPYSYTSAAIYPAGEPLVLILHTHGTEAYSPEGAISYPDDQNYARSSDPSENVIAVGERMAEVLRNNGVPTLHCVILHDMNAYRDAYVRAAETIAAYLAAYPSIEYVLDVHRDALIRGEADLVRPVVALDGEAVAQVMILAGSDYKGAYFPEWEENLAFALQLREALNTAHPGIARPVYLRGAAFNEHFGPRSLLLEIGASGNSLSEAIRAGERVAQTLAEMIKAA